MRDITTTDLAHFGFREREMLIELLMAWRHQGLPKEFYEQEVRAMMNMDSGNVFLTNEDYQVAMMNGDKLEIWHTCFECGNEGFAEDIQLCDEGCNECVESEPE